ncbi:hypothetical protein Tco_0387732, partial [Tanacetum coccineum]
MMKMVDQWWCWLSGDDGAMKMKMVDRWCWLSGDDGVMKMKMVDRWWCWLSGDSDGGYRDGGVAVMWLTRVM